MDWQDLLVAFSLYLILEGIIPFVSPVGFKRFMQQMTLMPDRSLRYVGFGSMMVGLCLLYLVR